MALISPWCLLPIKHLGGNHNQNWLVEYQGQPAVLRRYASMHSDIDYELRVLKHLHNAGWPVPYAIEPPTHHDDSWWCLFHFLPGVQKKETGLQEQRARGRWLAELHGTTASLTPLGQRHSLFARSDKIISDPTLSEAVRAYEKIRPDAGRVMRWHIERACECFEQLPLDDAEQIVLHSDFTMWNLLFENDTLSGILDFESTHLNFRVADFAMAWRGNYDEVIHGYEEVRPLSELDWQLLVPVFWAWLFLGVKDEISAILNGQDEDSGFEWQVKQLMKRSPLFGELAEPYRP